MLRAQYDVVRSARRRGSSPIRIIVRLGARLRSSYSTWKQLLFAWSCRLSRCRSSFCQFPNIPGVLLPGNMPIHAQHCLFEISVRDQKTAINDQKERSWETDGNDDDQQRRSTTIDNDSDIFLRSFGVGPLIHHLSPCFRSLPLLE